MRRWRKGAGSAGQGGTKPKNGEIFYSLRGAQHAAAALGAGLPNSTQSMVVM